MPILQEYINRESITTGLAGCFGSCTVDVPATGLTAVCSATETQVDYNAPLATVGTSNDSAAFENYPAFLVKFGYGKSGYKGPPAVIGMIVSYAQTTNCSGVIFTKSYNITQAMLQYHVAIKQGIISFAPPPNNLTVLGTIDANNITETELTNSTLGGLFIAARDLFSANVTLRWGGVIGFQPFGLTTFPSSYIGSGGDIYGCQYGWIDPTDDILAALNNIMFRTAISVMNGTTYSVYLKLARPFLWSRHCKE